MSIGALFGGALVLSQTAQAAGCDNGIGISINTTVWEGGNSATPAPTKTARIGDSIDYKVTLTLTASDCVFNDGTLTLTRPNDGSAQTMATGISLNPGDSVSFDEKDVGPASHILTDADLNAAGNVLTNAHVEGTSDVSPNDVPASADANTVNRVIHPETALTKTPDPDHGRVPFDVTYTIVESNISDQGPDSGIAASLALDSISNVVVSDSDCTPVDPTLDSGFNIGDVDQSGTLDPGESWTYTCQRHFDTTGTFPDTATATGDAGDQREAGTVDSDGAPADETAEASVTAGAPATELTETASPTSGPAPLDVTWTYKEHNTGTDPIDNVVVTADCSPVVPTLSGGFNVGDSNTNDVLDPDETWTYTCEASYSVDTTDHATATGTDTVDDTAAPDENAQASITIVTGGGASFTPGYFKNNHGGITSQLWPEVPEPALGNFTITSLNTVLAILKLTGCGGDTGLVNCVAEQTLVAEMQIQNGTDTCIQATIDDVNNIFKTGITPAYNGPGPNYKINSAAIRNQLKADQVTLSNYNQDAAVSHC